MEHPDELPERLERALKRTDQNFQQVYGPLVALKIAITVAASKAQEHLGPALGFSSTSKPSEPQILLMYEFLYFFSHLVLRTAVSEGLTESKIKKLQAFLGPWIVWTAVNGFFHHWPEHLKKKMSGEVYNRLNDAEMEYAKCRGLLNPENPLDAKTLLGRLSRNAMDLWDKSPHDPAAPQVVASVAEAITVMRLKEQVQQAADVIDLVDIKLITEFWSAGR
jgi:hypothetical protein